MSQELALGQRTGKDILMTEWHEDELQLMKDNGVTMDEVIKHWVIVRGEDTLNAAIGGVKDIRRILLDRNRPFQTQAEADADVSRNSGLPTPPVTSE